MGVTVLQIFPDQSRQGFKEADRLSKRIANLGAKYSDTFHVDCETFYLPQPAVTNSPNPRKLHIIHNSETPVTTYAVLDTGMKQVTLSADYLFDFLLPKISHIYQGKKNLKIESSGNRFEVGDFMVKIGQVMMTGQYKGILVEVEYLPCVVPSLCWSLVREFMQSFMGHSVPSVPPTFIQHRSNSIYTVQDTVLQYLEKFNEIREGQQSFSSTSTLTGPPSIPSASN